ncbi:CopY/TcrY family copper transport repressor [Liquorilactobacillus mali]|uniref:Transcriptional regulator n=1 Tax=Liquorilactobacillus mali TaxID=1618 RepID=A0A0R2FZD1_9LACO|nr:CopY/TcrY family copper transport repressor [Liquorilactobacillus mali]KRN30237.1 transcriptional regulator [Liquorilactobacillus mali]
MTAIDATKMSPAEWELMRIIWTKNGASSTEVIKLMQQKRAWTESTIKTLLRRLVNKKILKTVKDGRKFIYHPTVGEKEAMDENVTELFDHLCNMKKGKVVIELLSKLELSRSDIKELQRILEQKSKTAPEMVKCDCLPEGMKNECC